MSSTIEWEVWCETDNKWVSGLLYENVGVPTTCFENNAHTITNTGVKAPTIKKSNDKNIITIDEGDLTNTGKFNLTHLAGDISAGVDSVTILETYWNFPVGALKFSFDIEADMKGDTLNMFFNKNVIIGIITADIVVPTAWSAQNYVEGDAVTHSTYIGSNLIEFTYTCILNTISNDPPRLLDGSNRVNSIYWRKGLRLSLTPDQMVKVNDGYLAKVTTNPADPHGTGSALGEIWHVDNVNNYIYVSNSCTVDTPIVSGYLASTPTYFATGYQMVGDCTNGPFELNNSWHRAYGDDKIGAATINEEMLVTIEYCNRGGQAGKRFVGEVEILRGSGTHQ